MKLEVMPVSQNGDRKESVWGLGGISGVGWGKELITRLSENVVVSQVVRKYRDIAKETSANFLCELEWEL